MTAANYVRKVSSAAFDPLRGARPLLPSLDMELTERCNNSCIHCCINLPEDDGEAEGREMSTEFVLNILRQAADLGCLSVRLTGGEPLLRPDFQEIYMAARGLGMSVLLFTNARLVTPELAALFARMPPGLPVEVSVYGMSARSYDAVAGTRGAYDEFRRGVGLLDEYGIPFVVKSALLPQNREDVDAFEAWAKTIPWMERRPMYAVNFDLRSRRDDPAKNRRIAALRSTPGETVRLLADEASFVPGTQEFCRKFMYSPDSRLFPCGAGSAVAVDSYGMAQMCLPLRAPGTVFDLGTVSLRRVMTECFPHLRKLRATNPDYLRRCAACFLKGFCEQCPGKSWAEHGTLDTPVEYFCSLAHAKARYLELLGEGELAWEVRDGGERLERFASGG